MNALEKQAKEIKDLQAKVKDLTGAVHTAFVGIAGAVLQMMPPRERLHDAWYSTR